MPFFCAFCGNDLSPYAEACPKCGTPTETRTVAPRRDDDIFTPRPAGRLIGQTFELYFKHIGTLVTLTAVVVVPLQLLSAILFAGAVGDPESFMVPEGQLRSVEVDVSDVVRLFLVAFATGSIGALGFLLAVGAAFRAVTDAVLERPLDVRASLRFALDRLLSILWVTVLATVLASIALLALVVPGVWLWVSWSLAIPVLLVEGRHGWSAMARSFDLVRGRWWPVFGVQLAVILVGGIAGAIISLILSTILRVLPWPEVIAQGVAEGVASSVTTPLTVVAIALIYVELRARKEGLDRDRLASEIDGTAG